MRVDKWTDLTCQHFHAIGHEVEIMLQLPFVLYSKSVNYMHNSRKKFLLGQNIVCPPPENGDRDGEIVLNQ